MGKRKSIEQIRKDVENFKKSGISKKEYCKNQGISFNSLNWAITRLRHYEKSQTKNNEVLKSGFTCFEVKNAIESNPITVHFEKIRIELPENFNEQSFKKILTTIKSCHV